MTMTMKTILGVFLILLCCSCEALIPRPEDRAAIRQEIDQAYSRGTITFEQREAANAAIEAAGQSISWEQILSVLLGSVGAIFGVRGQVAAQGARRELAARGPAKPLTDTQIDKLHGMLK